MDVNNLAEHTEHTERPDPDRLTKVLHALVPYRMAEDLDAHADDPAFVAEQLRTYLTADSESQQEMADFHDGDGLDMIEDAIERLVPGHDAPQAPPLPPEQFN